MELQIAVAAALVSGLVLLRGRGGRRVVGVVLVCVACVGVLGLFAWASALGHVVA